MKSTTKICWLFSFFLLELLSSFTNGESNTLKSYNVDINQISVSGISSGGYFATQMQVAFSSIIKGAGIVAAGPYNCGGEKLMMYCMKRAWRYSNSVDQTKDWSDVRIDSIENMKKQRVYIISGKRDMIVAPAIVDQLYEYNKHFLEEKNIVYKKDLDSGHTYPTDFNSKGNAPCKSNMAPYISNCNFDAAGHILQHIYGDMVNRTQEPTGDLLAFKQGEFVQKPSTIGLAEEGYVYVPKQCQTEQCRLHVVFHGCEQNVETIKTLFIHNTGYDRWADNNRLILLFPQAHSDFDLRLTKMNGWSSNMNGCWDWLGWYDIHFQTRNGLQMSTIRKMIDRIAGVEN